MFYDSYDTVTATTWCNFAIPALYTVFIWLVYLQTLSYPSLPLIFLLWHYKTLRTLTKMKITLTSLAPSSSCGPIMSLFLAERGVVCGTSDTLFLGVLGVLGVLWVASSSEASLLLFLFVSSSFSHFLLGVTGGVWTVSSCFGACFRRVLLLPPSPWKNCLLVIHLQITGMVGPACHVLLSSSSGWP